jgi:predicted N-acetyltransferase YhbS
MAAGMTIRRVDAQEARTTVAPLQSYAFGATPAAPPEPATSEPASTQARRQSPDGQVRMVAFDGDSAAAVVVGIPMRQCVRGRALPMIGISGVAAHPTARRKGYVRALMDRVHGDMRDSGHVVSTLYPFKMSFYERFGYVGFPKARRIRLFPDGLPRVLHTDVPGEVTFHRIGEVFDTYYDVTERMLGEQHGVSVFSRDDTRGLGDDDKHWVVFARHDDEIVGTLLYQTKGIGEELRGAQFLARTPVGRMLLLRWLALHADQYDSFVFELPPAERPDVWYPDVQYTDETKIARPLFAAPMGRVLSVEGLTGIGVGTAVANVEVVDDPFVKGVWTLDGSSGTLEVSSGRPAAHLPSATLTAHGLAGLVYGVLDPDEIPVLGYGTVDRSAAAALRTLFPAAAPYLFSSF